MKTSLYHHLCLALILLVGLLTACSDELGSGSGTSFDESDLVSTKLMLGVTAMGSPAVDNTRAYTPDDDDQLQDTPDADELQGTEQERKIENIWVFQFDATTHQLIIAPKYYEIEAISPTATEPKPVDVLLKPNVSSIIYVVTNMGSDAWANVENSATLEDVQAGGIHNPFYIVVSDDGTWQFRTSIPMEGASEAVTPSAATTITVNVTRLYAKLEVNIGEIPESLNITDMEVSFIPFYSQVTSIAPASATEAATYPSDTRYDTYSFDPGDKNEEGSYTKTMTIYVPENIKGRTDNTYDNSANKGNYNVPENALHLNFIADYIDVFTGDTKEHGREYRFYPGGNNYNDFNIRRNYIYKITLNIYTDHYNQDIPSSNCFVVKPGQLLSFLPYYRTETGGGYSFEDYLDADGEESKRINKSDNMLDNVKIIWQTKDCIGDNSKGNLVWVDRSAVDEFHRKIYVRTNQPGNALIGAYNSSGELLWSWHIWVTKNEPANVSSAVVYSTYPWNEDGINTSVRVPGYAVMPCNIGALEHDPKKVGALDPDTHGMLYQWGRKDPFPPARSGNVKDYIDDYTGPHYANDNSTNVGKTSDYNKDCLFYSVGGNNYSEEGITTQDNAIMYTIQHPTAFLCGTPKAGGTEGESNNRNNQHNQGDWLPNGYHDNKLWGGLEPTIDGSMKYYTITETGRVQTRIFDNYGDQKSIFDPCPSGWRVPPGDLWLGFTSTGVNPQSNNEINYKQAGGAGMYLYMTAWRSGVTSFFPTQGTRVPNGIILRTGTCGNYHNATTELENRVNILHVHNGARYFHVFENEFFMYYAKSTGGPVRCVRDHK